MTATILDADWVPAAERPCTTCGKRPPVDRYDRLQPDVCRCCDADGCDCPAWFELRTGDDEPGDPGEVYCYTHGPAEAVELVKQGHKLIKLTGLPVSFGRLVAA